MIPLPNDINMADINQWLHGGWFFFRKDANSEPEPGSLCIRHEEYGVADLEGNEYNLVKELVYPYWPACGAINMDGFAVFVQREQVRQYRRTYNDACVTIEVPRKWDVMKRKGTKAGTLSPNDLDVVKAVFMPTYYTYSQALDMMETGQAVSVALNSYVIVTGQLVYYRNKLVAKIKGQKIVPYGYDISRIKRIIKFFEGRISL